jgi:hypothetical protein
MMTGTRTLKDQLKTAMTDTPQFIYASGARDALKTASTERRYYAGSMTNFLTQMRSAQTQMAEMWQRLLDEGYVEVAPGILRKGGTEVLD